MVSEAVEELSSVVISCIVGCKVVRHLFVVVVGHVVDVPPDSG